MESQTRVQDSQRVANMESLTHFQDSQSGQPRKGTSLLKTCFNGLNTMTGVGILTVPYAMSQGGWISLFLLLLVATICWYTGLLLGRMMDANPHIRTFPDMGAAAFGYKGRLAVATFIYLELYLVAVEFLILEGDNWADLFPNLTFHIGGIKIGSKKAFVLLTSLVMLPTTWFRNLGVLAYISVGGVLASVILLCCVVWAGTVDHVGFNEKGKLMNWGGFSTAVSVFSFCYCCHSLFSTLRSSMTDKRQFYKVLNVSFVTSTLNYGLMAILGYLMFGDHLESQVTLNLPTKRISTYIALGTTVVNPFAKYAVIITPIEQAIEEILRFTKRGRTICIITIRTTIVITTVLVALFVPFFGYIMSFIGAFSSVTISWLLPCLCYLKINKDARQFGLELMVMIGILLGGLFIGVLGTYNSVRDIVNGLRK